MHTSNRQHKKKLVVCSLSSVECHFWHKIADFSARDLQAAHHNHNLCTHPIVRHNTTWLSAVLAPLSAIFGTRLTFVSARSADNHSVYTHTSSSTTRHSRLQTDRSAETGQCLGSVRNFLVRLRRAVSCSRLRAGQSFRSTP